MATVLTSNLSGGEEGDLLEKQLSLAARISFRFNATCCCPFFFFLDSVSSFSCFSLRDFCSQFLEGGEGENIERVREEAGVRQRECALLF